MSLQPIISENLWNGPDLLSLHGHGPGLFSALWTFANLAPRAGKIHSRYEKEFGERFSRLNVKKIIPFIY